MKALFFSALLSVGVVTSLIAQTIDSKTSYITFEVNNIGKTVEGRMEQVEGTVQLDPRSLETASFEATVSPNTVHTGSNGRDKHLQKDDFFAVEEYPNIQLRSTAITKTTAGYEAKGLLTIKDIVLEVTIPFTVKEENGRQILEGNFEVLRKDYGLASNMGKMLIGLEVQVFIHAEVL